MANVQIKLDYAGVGQMLKSQEMAELMKLCVPMAMQATGLNADSEEADEYTGATRVNVSIGG